MVSPCQWLSICQPCRSLDFLQQRLLHVVAVETWVGVSLWFRNRVHQHLVGCIKPVVTSEIEQKNSTNSSPDFWIINQFHDRESEPNFDHRQLTIFGCFQKNRGKTPKMDGLFHGKPYFLMDDLGGPPLFLETPICQMDWQNDPTPPDASTGFGVSVCDLVPWISQWIGKTRSFGEVLKRLRFSGCVLGGWWLKTLREGYVSTPNWVL